MTHRILVQNGVLVFVHDDDLAESLNDVGHVSIRRASFVEPDGVGHWWADMSPVEEGVVLGPFRRRDDALAAERNWLRDHRGL